MEKTGCKLSISSYGNTMEWRTEYEDCDLEAFIDAFYGCMVGLTFHPDGILKEMKRFAEERLPNTEE